MPRPAKGSEEAKAWGAKMKSAREAKKKMKGGMMGEESDDELAELTANMTMKDDNKPSSRPSAVPKEFKKPTIVRRRTPPLPVFETKPVGKRQAETQITKGKGMKGGMINDPMTRVLTAIGMMFGGVSLVVWGPHLIEAIRQRIAQEQQVAPALAPVPQQDMEYGGEELKEPEPVRGRGAAASTPMTEQQRTMQRLQETLAFLESRIQESYQEFHENPNSTVAIYYLNNYLNNRNSILTDINNLNGTPELNVPNVNYPYPEEMVYGDLDVYPRALSQQISQENSQEDIPLAEVRLPETTGGKIKIGKAFKKIGKSFDKAGKDLTGAFGKAGTAVNPMTYALGNKKISKLMRQSGQLTNNYLLPAAVSAGLPLYYGAAGTAGMMLGGPLGALAATKAADTLWQEAVVKKGYDPRERQKSKVLGAISEKVGQAGASQFKAGMSSGKEKKVSGGRITLAEYNRRLDEQKVNKAKRMSMAGKGYYLSPGMTVAQPTKKRNLKGISKGGSFSSTILDLMPR